MVLDVTMNKQVHYHDLPSLHIINTKNIYFPLDDDDLLYMSFFILPYGMIPSFFLEVAFGRA